MRRVISSVETWPVHGVFRISRGSQTEIVVVTVEIREGSFIGRGECRPYARYGETPESVMAAIEAIRQDLQEGLERDELSNYLEPGAARNAIDCALWDLAAKSVGQPVWKLPVCADESCHDSKSLDRLIGLYDVVNIKLDKTGGLTEALQMKALASQCGFEVMVGCMVGTSLAMAPAFFLAQGSGYVDLDGPLLLAKDRQPGLHFAGSQIFPPDGALWGDC